MPEVKVEGMIEIVINLTRSEELELTEAFGQINNTIKKKDFRRAAYKIAHGPVSEREKFVKAAMVLADFVTEVLVDPEI